MSRVIVDRRNLANLQQNLSTSVSGYSDTYSAPTKFNPVDVNKTESLLRAFSTFDSALDKFADRKSVEAARAEEAAGLKQFQLDSEDDRKEALKKIKSGEMRETQSPFFVRAYAKQHLKAQAFRYGVQLNEAWQNESKNLVGDDGTAFQQFLDKNTQDFMQENGLANFDGAFLQENFLVPINQYKQQITQRHINRKFEQLKEAAIEKAAENIMASVQTFSGYVAQIGMDKALSNDEKGLTGFNANYITSQIQKEIQTLRDSGYDTGRIWEILKQKMENLASTYTDANEQELAEYVIDNVYGKLRKADGLTLNESMGQDLKELKEKLSNNKISQEMLKMRYNNTVREQKILDIRTKITIDENGTIEDTQENKNRIDELDKMGFGVTNPEAMKKLRNGSLFNNMDDPINVDKAEQIYNNITMSREDKISQIKEMVINGDLSNEKGKEFEAKITNIDMETMKTDFKRLYDKAEKVLKNSTELTDGKIYFSLDGGTEDFENYPERFEEIGNTVEELRSIMKVYRTEKATTKNLAALEQDTRKKIGVTLAKLENDIEEAIKNKQKRDLPKDFDEWFEQKTSLKSGYFSLSQNEQIAAIDRINDIGPSLLNVINKTDKQQNRHGQGRVAEVEENIIFKDFIEYKKLKDEKFEVEAFYTKEVFTEFVNFHARLKGMLGGPQ